MTDRKRRIKVGDKYGAVLFNQSGRYVGFTFEIIKESSYFCTIAMKDRKSFLGIKLYRDDYGIPHYGPAECYWFDDRGIASDCLDECDRHDFKFRLTKKR